MYTEREYKTMGQKIPNEWWGVLEQYPASDLSNHADRKHELE
jgi:hypothetical protein